MREINGIDSYNIPKVTGKSMRQELAKLEKYQQTLQNHSQKLADELARLFRLTHDEKSILNSARQLLEILLKELCRDVDLNCENNMVGTVLGKFREKANGIVPSIVPDDIYRSMDHINGLSIAGAHDKPYDPKQVREVLVALERVLYWYVVTYKHWQLTEPKTLKQTLFLEAQTLLEECAKSSDGMIYILPMIGRTLVIQTNEITFPPEEDSQPRTVARWKAALGQLESNGFIVKVKINKQEHFNITTKGYDAVEMNFEMVAQFSEVFQTEAVAQCLSEEARTILKKASVGVGEGQIIRSNTINNPFWLQINGTDPTGGDNSRRTRIRWEEALKQLEDKGLIEALSEKRDIFIITHDGYGVADTIGS